MNRLARIAFRIVLAALASLPPLAAAQAYPSKPVRLIVPFPAGGGTDIVGRAVGQRMSGLLGQQVIVDNRGGAGGMIGVDAASKAPADGYTILIAGVGEVSMFPSLYRKLPYDPQKDLAPIGLIATTPQVLIANPAVLPVANLRELIAYAKANPGKINYGTFGPGSLNHIMMEQLARQTGMRLTAIQYKGSAPALTDMLGGQISLMILSPALARSPMEAGKLRGLAVTSRERLAALPDLVTLHEAGAENYDSSSWFGLFAPAGVPRDVVATLSSALMRAVQSPEVSKNLLGNGILPKVNSPEEFSAFVRTEIEKWGAVINGMGLKLD